MGEPLKSPPQRHNMRAQREGWPTLCDDKLAFVDARLKDLVEVWNAVRGGKALPMRTDFSARVLVRHLKDIAFLECVPLRRYRFGFFGSAMARYSGDCTGKHLDEIIPAQFLPAWLLAYDTALEHGAPLRFVSNFRAFNLEHMSAESFAAPLGDAAGMPCGLLVSVVYTPRVS